MKKITGMSYSQVESSYDTIRLVSETISYILQFQNSGMLYARKRAQTQKLMSSLVW
jgi:hypothetical protein